MPRWYAGFRCVGKPVLLLEQIGKVVQREGLARFIPNVRVEKGARKQFYLFIAIEGAEVGEAPSAIDGVFRLPFLSQRLPEPLTLDQIRSMTSAGIDVVDFGGRIPYWIPPQVPDEDPFDVSARSVTIATDEEAALRRTRQYDRLVVWLSATAAGSWGVFRKACQDLGLDGGGTGAGSILRCLRLLGHVECSRDGRSWTAAPAVLARRDHLDSSVTTFLCGQRDGQLLSLLREFADVAVVPQPHGGGPSTMYLGLDHEVLLTVLKRSPPGVELHDGGDIAAQLARALPSLKDWMDTLQLLAGILPHMLDAKRFTGSGFAPVAFDGRSGFYELWPLSPSRDSERPKYRAYYDAEGGRWLSGDWYGLRFLALHNGEDPCPARYESTSARLAIPMASRWPELYERALVLAGGRLPTHQGPWLVYDGISSQLLRELDAKLPLRLEEHHDA